MRMVFERRHDIEPACNLYVIYLHPFVYFHALQDHLRKKASHYLTTNVDFWSDVKKSGADVDALNWYRKQSCETFVVSLKAPELFYMTFFY